MAKGRQKNKQRKQTKTKGKNKGYSNIGSDGNVGGKRKARGGKNEMHTNDDYCLRQSIIGEDGKRNIIEMAGDGNCLFRSLSDQLFHDYGNGYEQIRSELCKFLEENESEFGIFLLLDDDEEDVREFSSYLSEMREDGTWGGDVEIACAARLYKRKITVFSVVGAYNIGIGDETPSGPDLLLSYHENSHYNSVQDESVSRSFQNSHASAEAQGNCDTMKTKTIDISDAKTTSTRQRKDKNQCALKSYQSLNGETKDINRKSQNGTKQKRNDLCSCGSGLLYKKCCLAATKNQEKLAKWKEKRGLGKTEGKDNIDDVTHEDRAMLEGGFCVLNI
mmetsp:Transcript_36860/g.44037  ORF Transcript_36860/g.44037 Transcript_36860/m.44037 type:complete len:333 (+) Transcript_36860:232-1230(+)